MDEALGLVRGDEELETLVRDLQSGAPGAGERLWPVLRRIASARFRALGVEREQDREDLLQELSASVLRIVTSRGWRPTRSFAGFLQWRALGVFSAWARRRRHEPMHPDPVGMEALPEHAEGPAEACAHDDERRALTRRIGACRERLAGKARRIWCLRYEGRLDLAEIGRELGMTPNAVAVVVCRANERMRACLRAAGFEP